MVELIKRRMPLYVKVLPFYAAVLLLFVVLPVVSAHRQLAQVQAEGVKLASRVASSKSTVTTMPLHISGTPTRIVLPSVGIDLPIVAGTYDKAANVWSVAGNTANYATNTPLLDNLSGTPVIYGHALVYVFGRTEKLQPGDMAYIYTSNGHVFQYTFSSKVVINPTDTTLFARTQTTHGLDLLTCDGTWSQNRRLMSFTYVGVS